MWPFCSSKDELPIKKINKVIWTFEFTLRDGTRFIRKYEWDKCMNVLEFMSMQKSSGFIWDGKDTYYPIVDIAKIFQF